MGYSAHSHPSFSLLSTSPHRQRFLLFSAFILSTNPRFFSLSLGSGSSTMAIAARIRSTSALRLLRCFDGSESIPSHRALLCPNFTLSQRNYATAPAAKEIKVKIPVSMYGGNANYASALYLAAVKSNALEKVEGEFFDLVEASKKSSTFSQFTKDVSVPSGTRVKAITDICAQAKFSDITKNFLVILAQNGRLRYMDSIAKRFLELTMAHKGEMKAVVTSVIPLPAEEEKELRETLQEILGKGKKVILEQKIDPSILGGIVVEFGQKVLDMSIRTRARQMERFLREPVNFDSL